MKPKPVMIVLCFNCLVCVSCNISPACECVVYQSDGGSQGTFTSPNFPQIYPSNINCILYTFLGSMGEIVELTFLEFDLQVRLNSSRCKDYIRFYLDLDRPEINEQKRHNYEECGNISMIEKQHYSSERSLIFEFHTDSFQGNHTGFRGRFKFLNDSQFDPIGCKMRWGNPCVYDCKRSSLGDRKQGRFFSPRYPQNYEIDKTCIYHFYGNTNERVRVNFENIQLERVVGSCTSSPDAIIVHDGKDETANVIKTFCNTMNGAQVTSSGDSLYIIFKSSPRVTKQGFAATFEFIKHNRIPPKVITTSMPTQSPVYTSSRISGPYISQPRDDPDGTHTVSADCDEVYSSNIKKTGIITSPGYPKAYSPNLQCSYTFEGHGKERVQLEFLELDLLYGADADDPFDCESSDIVEIQIQIDNNDKNLGVYCGRKQPPLLMSNNNNMEVIFKTEPTKKHNHRGFKAKYTFVTDFGIEHGQQIPNMECGFKFNSSVLQSGHFTSPNFPGLYPRNTECHYLFHGQGGEKVHITFPYFDVEGIPPSCSVEETDSDFIEFSNFEPNLPDRKMSRFCGSMEELSKKEVESDGNFFRVLFKSNGVYDATGFDAFYQFRKHDATNYPPGGEDMLTASQDKLHYSIFFIFLCVCFTNLV